jgi:hypothetical protein
MIYTKSTLSSRMLQKPIWGWLAKGYIPMSSSIVYPNMRATRSLTDWMMPVMSIVTRALDSASLAKSMPPAVYMIDAWRLISEIRITGIGSSSGVFPQKQTEAIGVCSAYPSSFLNLVQCAKPYIMQYGNTTNQRNCHMAYTPLVAISVAFISSSFFAR